MLSPIVLEGDLSNLGWIRNVLKTPKGGGEKKKSRWLDREGEQMTSQPPYPTPETRCIILNSTRVCVGFIGSVGKTKKGGGKSSNEDICLQYFSLIDQHIAVIS